MKEAARVGVVWLLGISAVVACHDATTGPSKVVTAIPVGRDEVASDIPPEGPPRETPGAPESGEGIKFSSTKLVGDVTASFAITSTTTGFSPAMLSEALSRGSTTTMITVAGKFGGTNQSAVTNVARGGFPTDGGSYLIVSSGDARTPGVDAAYGSCSSDSDYGTLCDRGGATAEIFVPLNATALTFDYQYFAFDYSPYEDPFQVFVSSNNVSTRIVRASISTEFGTKPSAGLQYGPVRHVSIDLTAYRGKSISLAFQASDRSDQVNAGGAMIDNLAVAVANTPPTITAPANVAFVTDPGACTATVTKEALGTPTFSDDAPGVVISASRPNNADAAGAYEVGQTTVTWTATDAGGLTATANQTVMVSDAERPSISAPAPVTVNTDPHSPAAVVTLSSAVATDNCPGVTVTGPTGANSYPIGTTTVSWTAIDAAGNTSSASSTITVIDNEPPTITVPASFTVNATMPTGAIVTYNIVASDNSGFASASCSRASGSVFAIGPTLVTCTATDGSGNTSAPTSFTITVRGAPEQIQNLITFVSGLSLPPGTSQPVLAMLATALRDPGAVSPQVGCSKLDDFITKLADHKAVASISVYAINQMIADATRIKSVLGCP